MQIHKCSSGSYQRVGEFLHSDSFERNYFMGRFTADGHVRKPKGYARFELTSSLAQEGVLQDTEHSPF